MSGRGALPRLMLITDRRRLARGELADVVRDAARGGVGIVQVREKDLPDEDLRGLVARIRAEVARQVHIVVNSRWRVARTLRLGLHLPASADFPGRAGLTVVGRSVHDAEEAARAADEQVDYVIAGPVFPTPSKPGHPGSGLHVLSGICEVVSPVPVFAIGGIQVSRVPEVIRAGAHGVAVCGALMSASDPERIAQALLLALDVSTRGAARTSPAGGPEAEKSPS